MVIEFDVTKMKKRGGKLSPNNCYSNPLYYNLCIGTAMGFYFSFMNSTWSYDNQYMIFIKPRSRDGSASSRYTDCIKDWVTIFFTTLKILSDLTI